MAGGLLLDQEPAWEKSLGGLALPKPSLASFEVLDRPAGWLASTCSTISLAVSSPKKTPLLSLRIPKSRSCRSM